MKWLSRLIPDRPSSAVRHIEETSKRLDELVMKRQQDADDTVVEERAKREAIDQVTGNFIYDAMRGYGIRPKPPYDPKGRH